jgi:cysteine desulfurase
MRIGSTLYFDHHATTPVDRRVLAKMLPYFTESFGNPHSSEHSLGWEAGRETEVAAAQLGRLIGAEGDEIVFTSGATEANNFALLGLVERDRRRVLLSSIDHKSALAVGRVLRGRGVDVVLLGVTAEGSLNLDQLEMELKAGPCLVSVSLVNSEIGTIQDVKKVGGLAHQYGALLHWDAAQAPCAIDVGEVAREADLVSLSAHKMYGPKGIGALYIRRGVQKHLEPLIHGGGQQNNLRSGTLPVPLCVGFGAAAEIFSLGEAGKERERIRMRRDRFVELVRDVEVEVALNGPEGSKRHPGNANVRFSGISGHDLLGMLQPKLAASTGSACSSGIPEPSHVLKGIGLGGAEVESSVRFCIGRYTTDADVSEAASLIREVVSSLVRAGREVA